nr:hypothetical protein [Micromonospora sp. DSM 115978]
MPGSTGADTVGGDTAGSGVAGEGTSVLAPPDLPTPSAPAESGNAPTTGGRSGPWLWWPRWGRPEAVTIYVAVLAVLSATAAVLVHHLVFPVLSINNDEGIYLLHAQTLADGRLFPPTPDQPGSFT